VTIALTQNNAVAISNGIAPGEVVVIDGQDKLQPKMKVEPRAIVPGGSRNSQGAEPTPGAP